jgi:integrase
MPNAALFKSNQSWSAISVSTFNNLVKSWCKCAGINENTGSHTLRKTWGYHQRVRRQASIPVLMVAFGHTSERQTLEYLCIQDDEIQTLYLGVEM